MTARAILHVDMDAFYASVEVLDRPELRGTPLIVGGLGGRGVVAAASYAVRAYGVHSAMPMSRALRLCPHAVCVRPRMSRYREISSRVFTVFRRFTPAVEGISLDEAFLDLTGTARLLGTPSSVAVRIKQAISEETGLTASVGLAANKLLAKIASDLNKPDGFCHIDAGHACAVLDPLPIGRLLGIGQKTLPRVQAAGVQTFADLRTASDALVWKLFGREGVRMRERAAGIDDRPVVAHADEKSISSEETFALDLTAVPAMVSALAALSDRTASRLRAAQLQARCVTVKIRRADFFTSTRQHAVRTPIDDTHGLFRVARELLLAWRLEEPHSPVRLLGVGVSQLAAAMQPDLFAAEIAKPRREDAAVDAIRRRFGARGIIRGASLALPDPDSTLSGARVQRARD